jgi:hypothetical protein
MFRPVTPVFYRGSTLFAVGFDPITLSVLGEPHPVVQNVDPSRWSAFEISSDGTLVYIDAVDRTGGELVWVSIGVAKRRRSSSSMISIGTPVCLRTAGLSR